MHSIFQLSDWSIRRILGVAVIATICSLSANASQAADTPRDGDKDSSAMQMVYYRVTIEVSGGDRNSQIADELKITTLNSNTATVEFGQEVTIPTGAVTSSRGPRTITYSQKDVGTHVQVQPEIVSGKVVTKLQLEKSWVENVGSEEQDYGNWSVFSTTLKTVLASKDGESETVTAEVTSRSGQRREVIITVTASTRKITAKKAVARRPPGQRPNPAESDRTGRSSTFGGFSRDRARSERRPDVARQSAQRVQGAQGVFNMLDKDDNKKIDKEEWKDSRLGMAFESRGFQFEKDMDLKAFESAMSKMIGKLREPPNSSDSTSDAKKRADRDSDSKGKIRPDTETRRKPAIPDGAKGSAEAKEAKEDTDR